MCICCHCLFGPRRLVAQLPERCKVIHIRRTDARAGVCYYVILTSLPCRYRIFTQHRCLARSRCVGSVRQRSLKMLWDNRTKKIHPPVFRLRKIQGDKPCGLYVVFEDLMQLGDSLRMSYRPHRLQLADVARQQI